MLQNIGLYKAEDKHKVHHYIKNVTAETPVFRHGEELSLHPLFTFSKNYDIILLMRQCIFYNFFRKAGEKSVQFNKNDKTSHKRHP